MGLRTPTSLIPVRFYIEKMSKEDNLWFKHESTSGKSLKIRKLQRIHGHWGKGIYWDVCEFLLEQDQFCFVCDESSLQVVSDMIGCKDEVKFLSWYKDCLKLELLESDGVLFWCPALINRLGKLISSRENGGKGGRPKNNLTKTQLKPNHNPTITYDNHTKSKSNTKRVDIYIKKEILNSQTWLEATAKNNSTSLENLKASFEIFWNLHLYDSNPENKNQSEIQIHFGNWLKTNKPKEIILKAVDEVWGVKDVDYAEFNLKREWDTFKFDEMIKSGWVKYNEFFLRLKLKKS